MDFLKNLSIAYKITGAFIIVILLNCIMGTVIWIRTESLINSSDLIEHAAMPSINQTGKLKFSFSSVRRLESQILIPGMPNEAEERISLAKRIRASREETRKHMSDLLESVGGNDEAAVKYRALISDTNKKMEEYFAESEKALKFVEENEISNAIQIMFVSSRKLFSETNVLMDKIVQSNEAFAKLQGEIIDAESYKSKRALLVGTGLVVFFSMVLSWLIVRMIVSQVNLAVQTAEKVASGDLTTEFPAAGKDEIGKLLSSISHMQISLISLVKNVRQGSESVNTASSEIAMGNQDLSSRTESQASALEETAASMEELSSTVNQNADSAQEASKLAASTATVAAKGGEVVNLVVQTMQDINASSKKINDIISVIDGIAFQTNLLALNAAVEAARAGEQGKGFAVVASEVRNLAGRSAEAAKQIKHLISESTEKVTTGVNLADAAGNEMKNIVDSVNKVTSLISDISSASREQAQGVAQVGEAVGQMDTVTQQNAALVEEMAAAATSLKSQSEDLVKLVETFKLPGGQDAQTVYSPVKNASASQIIKKSPRQPFVKVTTDKSKDDWESF